MTNERTTDSLHEVHMIGNAHMDPVWVWDWREGFGEVWSTFRSALERIAEHPLVTFTASSAAYYAWIERHDPAMFDEIRTAVARGRWCVVGGMWVEPDCNIPSGESLCRQLLHGQRYFERAFGHRASVGYNIDSFGHAAGLPSLLLGAGLDAYVMMRPGPHERDLPASAFAWSDPSGRAIATFRIHLNYETDSVAALEGNLQEVAALASAEGTPQMCFFGVGNHGGGPTKSMLEAIDARASSHDALYSDPERYFARLESLGAELAVVEGELEHHAVGCYSASSWVKAANRHAETALLDAETLEAIACRLVGRRSELPLAGAWEEFLLCQFHDVLAGTSSGAAYDTIRARYGYVETVADTVTTNALYEIAHRVDTRLEAVGAQERESPWTVNDRAAAPFLVYNPLAWPVKTVVTAPRSAARVLDSAGREVASQVVTSAEVTIYPANMAFEVALGPLGYEVYWLQGSRLQTVATPSSPVPIIERGRFRVAADPSTGALSSVLDLATATELVREPGLRPLVLVDESDTWSHGLRRYEGDEMDLTFEGWEVVEDGPVRSTLRLRFRCGDSRLVEDVTLSEGASFVEVRLRAQWATPRSVVKLVLPWRLGPDATTVAGASYSHQERVANGDEEVMQGWLDCFDERAKRGIGVTTDHLYGYDAHEGTIRLTYLRNPLAADHGGYWATRVGEDFPLADSGAHDATVRIHPHREDWRAASLPALADEHHRPPILVADTYHGGTLAAKGSFLDVEGADHVVRAAKRAENAEGLVLRLVESIGGAVTSTLGGALLGRDIDVALAPYEVRTLLVPDDEAAPVREVDLAEFDVTKKGR